MRARAQRAEAAAPDATPKRSATSRGWGAELGVALDAAGRPLPALLRERLEQALGADLSDVRLHTDASADSAARALDAEAVAIGRRILFRAGAYRPETESGFRLILHEAAHVVQQRGAATAPVEEASAPHDAVEREAETAVADAQAGREPRLSSAPIAAARRAAGIEARRDAAADPARLVGQIAEKLLARFREDFSDHSGRLRRELIRMEERLRRDVLRRIEKAARAQEWGAFLALIAEPVPAVEELPGAAGAESAVPAEGKETDATVEESETETKPDEAQAAEGEAATAKTGAEGEAAPVGVAGPVAEGAVAETATAAPEGETEAAAVPDAGAPAEEAATSEVTSETAGPPVAGPAQGAATAASGGATAVEGAGDGGAVSASDASLLAEGAEPEQEEPVGAEAEAEEAQEAAPEAEEGERHEIEAEDGVGPAAEPEPEAEPGPASAERDEGPAPSAAAPAPEPAPASEPAPAPAAEPAPEQTAAPEPQNPEPAVPAAPDASAEPAAAEAAPSSPDGAPPASLLGEFSGEPVEVEAPEGGGGGGGGAAVPEPVEEPPVEAPADDPQAALGALGGVSVGRAARGIGGAAGAVKGKSAKGREALAAAPPSLERPAVAAEGPRAAPASPGAAKTVERVAASGASPAQAVAAAPVSLSGPQPTVTAAQVSGTAQGQLSEQDAQRVKQAVKSVATTDPGLDVSAGAPPALALDGDADPELAARQSEALDAAGDAARADGAAEAAAPMGEDAIEAEAPAETLQAEAPAHACGGGPSGKPEDAPCDAATAKVAEEEKGDEVRAAASKGASQVAEKAGAEAGENQDAHTASAKDVDGAITDDARLQEEERGRAKKKVAEHRKEWSEGQDEAVKKASVDATVESDGARTKADVKAREGRSKAEGHVSDGNEKIAVARADAEKKARAERDKAEREADGGVLGWLTSAIGAFFTKLRDAIHNVFDAARKFVKDAIETAQKLAAAAVDAARRVVVALVQAAAAAIVFIADQMLAAFPGLRDKFRKLIKDAVDAALAAVNRFADDLKRGLQKLLGFLGSVLEGILCLYEKLYMAIVGFVADRIKAAIDFARAAIAALGLFADLVKDIAADPLLWIKNLGAGVMDGVRNHLWKALKTAVKAWFNDTVEQIVGLGKMLLDALKRGKISLKKIAGFVWSAILAALPAIVIQFLIERLIAMIVPAAGAIMMVVQGIIAAWGSIQRIIAAAQAFFAFLRAVKGGASGPLFAQAVALSAVAVIQFLAMFLLARLAKAAGKVAGKLKALASKLIAFFKRAGRAVKRGAGRAFGAARRVAGRGLAAARRVAGRAAAAVGRGVRRVGRALGRTRVGQAFRRGAGRVRDWGAKQRRRFKDWRERRRQRAQARKQERLDKAVRALQPKVRRLLAKGPSRLVFAARLAAWRLWHRLSRLDVRGAQLYAAINPQQLLTDLGEISGVELGRRLELILQEVERDMLDEEAREMSTSEATRLGRAALTIQRGGHRSEQPQGLTPQGQYLLLRSIVNAGVIVAPSQRGRFLSAIVRPGQPGFSNFVNVAVADGRWIQTGAGIYVMGAGAYPMRESLLDAPSGSGLVHVVEPSRMSGQLATERTTEWMRRQGFLEHKEVFGATASHGSMTAQGSARAADVDEGRSAPSTDPARRAEEEAARMHRRRAIRNIFKRLVEAVTNNHEKYKTLPAGEQAAMNSLVDAFRRWVAAHFRGPKGKLVRGGTAEGSEAQNVAGARLYAELRLFLERIGGGL